ncbi:myosin light chain kinase 3-like isoform X2 [Alosa alosa]|uniref:myosin light chain kinase 3-like isoform X2 n=1 Tax=Alosa alosa TaxID=278164 RepID=UPI0020151B4E|nr:myosin light chain kinase 3-like isoform X2 [Alosa alosa]
MGIMENFLGDRDVWIVGSVCLIASFVWRRLWNLFGYKRKGDATADVQFKAKKDDETFQLKNLKSQKKKKTPDDSDTAQALLSEEVQKLNKENFQCSYDDCNDAETSLSDFQVQESKETVELVSEKGKEKRETDAQLEQQLSEEVQKLNQENFQCSYDDLSDAEGSHSDLQLLERKETVDLVSDTDKEKRETDTPLEKQLSEVVQNLNQENFQRSYDDHNDAESSVSDMQLQESKETVDLVSEKDKEKRETDTPLEKQLSEVVQNLNQENIQCSYDDHNDAESSVRDMQLQESKETVDLVSEKDKERRETDTPLEKQLSEVVQNLNQENFQCSYDDGNDAESSVSDMQLQERKETVDLVSEKDKERRETDVQLEQQLSEEVQNLHCSCDDLGDAEGSHSDLQLQERRETVELVSEKDKEKKEIDTPLEKQLSEVVQNLNQENFQRSYDDHNDAESSVSDMQLRERKETVDLVSEKDKEKRETDAPLEKKIEKHDQEPGKHECETELEEAMQKHEAVKEEEIKKEESKDVDQPHTALLGSSQSSEAMLSSKRHLSQEYLQREEQKKSRKEEKEEEEEGKEKKEEEQQAAEVRNEAKTEEGKSTAASAGPPHVDVQDGEASTGEYIIDSSPPPPAPFEHRIVTTKTQQINAFYTINLDEILGGGRFGQVHKCVEKASGMTLAAKIIKARSQKEKDDVKNEIQVMNQLDHANLIQLYAAFESRYGITLVLEYVEGGELFDRIIDDSCNVTELDTVLFIRQISEGLQYMHRMYILHLDLKPENILCVSRETNKIKIIDFGLARRYKPREKLRVNFGTPEFLAPEVINYDFVSFPTDMWSLGVITYMLLSGLSPFLGDDDHETLNNILACQWSFEVAEFAQTSDEAKDFITRLLVKSKCWRMSASQSLKHPWLSDRGLHYRLYERQKQLDLSKDTPPPPAPES